MGWGEYPRGTFRFKKLCGSLWKGETLRFADYNTPLISVSPLKAYIGLKEGVTEKSRFEVLEAELSKEGKMTYKRVGVIQPKENLIWDNRYMASEEQAYGSDFGFTTFRKVSGGDFYPGMLIREIK